MFVLNILALRVLQLGPPLKPTGTWSKNEIHVCSSPAPQATVSLVRDKASPHPGV